MFLIEIAVRPIKALKLRLRSVWLGVAARLRRWQFSALERNLDHSADRFELERRERAWGRRHHSEASLLGE